MGMLTDKNILAASSYDLVFKDFQAFSDTSLRRGLTLYHHAGAYIAVCDARVFSEENVQISAVWNVSLFDSSISRTVLPIDDVFLDAYERIHGVTNDRWILRLSDSSMLIAAEGALLRYDRTTGEGREICSFPKSDRMYATYDTGTDISAADQDVPLHEVVPKKFRRLFHLPTQKSETLYRADPDPASA
jgi:hypothetical protein